MGIAFRCATVALTAVNVSGAQSVSFSGTQPSAGDAVFVAGGFQCTGGPNSALAVTDNQGNGTYANDENQKTSDSVSDAFISSMFNVLTGATFTVNVAPTPSTGEYISAGAIAFSGVVASLALDQHTHNNLTANTTTVPTGTTGTTTRANEVSIISFASQATINVGAITAPGYTVTAAVSDGVTTEVGGVGYQILSSTGTQAATWTFANTSGLGTDQHVAAIATYLGLAGTITVQPTDQIAAVGATAAFSITATNATAYQWQDDRTGVFTDVSGGSGATTASYTTATVTQDMNRRYRCVVDASVFSNSARLFVGHPYAWAH